MKHRHEIYPYLCIMDFEESPEAVVQRLGITPSKSWSKGEIRNSKIGKVYESNGIHLAAGLGRDADFEDQLASLFSIITANMEEFVKVCNSCRCELRCVIYLYHDSKESTPTVHFDKHAVEVLAKLGAEIDIDLYAL